MRPGSDPCSSVLLSVFIRGKPLPYIVAASNE